ncbi:MAG TPA: diguanylate cyclase [Terracidiphilus sp.]|nr:diguanylate cyclase [Terracidiphilus sp.]
MGEDSHRAGRQRWLRKHGFPVRVAACFFLVTLATVFIGLAPESNLIWVANGLLLAYLLLAPRRRWPAYLCAGLVAQMTGDTLVNPHSHTNLILAVLNIGEVTIAASLLRGRSKELPHFTDLAYLMRFAAIAMLLAPAAVGSLFALTVVARHSGSPLTQFVQWVIADGLGTAVMTPACVAIFRDRFSKRQNWARNWAYLVLPAAFTVVVFSQTRVPVLFLVYPILLIVLLRLGLGWASLVALFVATVGSWFTLRGEGAFAMFSSLSPMEPSIILQIFIAGAMFMLYSVSVVLGNHTSVERRLQKIASIHALVTENSRDAILIVDFDGKPSYVSPAMESMTGWKAEEMMRLGGPGVVHPDDLAKVAQTIAELRACQGSGMTEYRVRKRNGEYIWVEASLCVFVDPATKVPIGTMNIVRDITGRKRAEQELRAANRALEALAVVDPLTGIANRRRLDQSLVNEWRRGQREHTPLSLVLFDADFFKSYNDTYGHLRGDYCLKQIAEAALDVVARPGDVVARYGGEEFAVVLPNTGEEGALQIAEQICESLRRRFIPHSFNPYGIATVSAGCATMLPGSGQSAGALIEMADRALYLAKETGRNRACSASALDDDAPRRSRRIRVPA